MVCSYPRCDCVPIGMERPEPCPASQECQAFRDIRELGDAADRLLERPTRVWDDSTIQFFMEEVRHVRLVAERVQSIAEARR